MASRGRHGAFEGLPDGVVGLAESSGALDSHTEQVCRLALSIFDQTVKLHGLGRRERSLLQCGAALHDIGLVAGTRGHHRRACEMILAAGSIGLDEHDRLMAALLARYHRKAPPGPGDELYEGLREEDRTILGMLAGILRVADGLDRTHSQVIDSVRVSMDAGSLRLRCTASRNADDEKFYGTRKGDLLEKVTGLRLRISVTGSGD
jgi:exopolyphosphatase/guanosine-5'-triphosphate,3'-diphosphate pyrophosphatase